MEKLLVPSDISTTDEIFLHTAHSKNSLLPLLFASTLHRGVTNLKVSEASNLGDVIGAINILRHIGANVTIAREQIAIDTSRIRPLPIPLSLSQKTRYSLLALGCQLARCGTATVALPGGCKLNRPINFHVELLRNLGCNVSTRGEYVEAIIRDRPTSRICLPYPSVGTTLQALLCTATNWNMLKVKEIILDNCAIEPEIDDVIFYLRKLGAKIQRLERRISIEPVEIETNLLSVSHEPIRDRIEAGSYAIAAAILQRVVRISHAPIDHMTAIIQLLRGMGCHIDIDAHRSLIVDGRCVNKKMAVKLIASPYPGLPTDLQPLIATLCTQFAGPSTVRDEVIPQRTEYIKELKKLGAGLEMRDGEILASFENNVSANDESVIATDIRGAMAVALYAMSKRLPCRIKNFDQLTRGYVNIENNFKKFGFDINDADNFA